MSYTDINIFTDNRWAYPAVIKMMETDKLIPHLFRAEFSKIVSVLTRDFGLAHIEVAEDIASETFTAALETWPRQGVPPNPAAWLYSVAKNKVRNHINRSANFSKNILPEIRNKKKGEEALIDLSEKSIRDSQLQVLFAICHPVIAQEAQIGLALRILCGFGIQEIADAFLTNKETINKRLFRAKKKLKSGRVKMELPGHDEVENRLETVLTTLYLLFNEGYYSESKDIVVRKDLCLEAMRLTYLLIVDEQTNRKAVNALMALMCFHSSRLKARTSESGEFILYQDQDESVWEPRLIERGMHYLIEASSGQEVTKYHLEAGIAYWHTKKKDTSEKWKNILKLYNKLLILDYSPIAALNRTFVLSKVYGKKEAIAEAKKLALDNNHYYFTLLGALNKGIDTQKARAYFLKALTLAKSNTDRQTITQMIQDL